RPRPTQGRIGPPCRGRNSGGRTVGSAANKRDTPSLGWEDTSVNLLAWILLGAVAASLGGFLVRGDERRAVIGHSVLGIVGAVVGGFLASALFNVKNPIQGALDLSTIVISIIGAILVVVVVSLVTGSRRVGRGPV